MFCRDHRLHDIQITLDVDKGPIGPIHDLVIALGVIKPHAQISKIGLLFFEIFLPTGAANEEARNIDIGKGVKGS